MQAELKKHDYEKKYRTFNNFILTFNDEFV